MSMNGQNFGGIQKLHESTCVCAHLHTHPHRCLEKQSFITYYSTLGAYHHCSPKAAQGHSLSKNEQSKNTEPFPGRQQGGKKST